MEIKELLERVEKAVGPDRELDREIGLAIGGWSLGIEPGFEEFGTMLVVPTADGSRSVYVDAPDAEYPALTESVDAALALVEKMLPGWAWHISKIAGVPSRTLKDCEAAGRHIPLVVENVRGAQPWVGRARWNFGSFYLWGDVPALMPVTFNAHKVPSFRFDGSGRSFQTASVRRADVGRGTRFTSRDCGDEGRKQPGIKLSEVGFNVSMARAVATELKGAKYKRTAEDKRQHIGINRKAASAMIAKIPLPLSRHIAAVYHPARAERPAA